MRISSFIVIFAVCAVSAFANDPLADEAKAEFEKFVAANVPNGTDFTLIVDGKPNNYGEVKRYEMLHPRFHIVAENLEAQRAALDTAQKLNGELKDVQWRGAAIVTAAAYRLVEVIRNKKSNTIELFKERVDNDWHPIRGVLPLVGHFNMTKEKDAWSIKRWRGGKGGLYTKHKGGGSSGSEAWLDPKNAPDAKLYRDNMNYDSSDTYLLTQVATGDLTKKPIDSDPRLKTPAAPAMTVVQYFESLAHARTAETMTFVFEERESKATLRSANDNPYFQQQKTTEFHSPRFESEDVPATQADRLNGITARAEVKLHFDAMRHIKFDPPLPRIPALAGYDGKWASKGEEHYVAYYKENQWVIYPYFARDRGPEDIGFRIVPKP